ncbi:MAG: UDP-glucose 4-epimerase [Candidatus Woesebacteria bacterium GW2011_GWB1_45_5]|uniref:UDP-glucose 4-epimerase n=1 Tax=Candidatus Woesebacteria bacterium GW2011_GWB1_45_5 TaxID=1618581 RepID=A0A0G1MLE0_9BACT|nr:MAG: UDP-glucose 4-epimerase [Candidatus Woesebacteria bacterium GW2011_GWB1_45_5]
MQKILVTGGAGYIGSFMVRELKSKGFDPVILDNLSQGHEKAVEGFRLERIDLVTDKEKLDSLLKSEKFDGVVHMASFIQMGESYANPGKYYRNNVIGFLNLLESVKENNVSNVILSSSAGVYGNPVKVPIEESDLKNPLNPYGETKYIMERMLEDYDAAYGIKFAAIRYFNAAGAALDGSIGENHSEESHLIPNIIKSVLEGKEFTLFGDDYLTPDGTCIRDYIHVLDLVETHSLALQKLFDGAESAFFNAGLGQGYSNKEVIGAVEKVTGQKVKVKVEPKRAGDADALYASNEKIKKELNWMPKYSLEDIVKSAHLWHKSHPQGYNL